MVTDKELKEWRDTVTKLIFTAFREDRHLTPYVFFLTNDKKRLGAVLKGNDPIHHRSIISTICRVREIHADRKSVV